MEILGVSIENFRGIKAADIRFHGHALLVGSNNAGKTTILEALDLALGPDRNQGPNTIDEHDFFRGNYYEYREPPRFSRRPAYLSGTGSGSVACRRQ